MLGRPSRPGVAVASQAAVLASALLWGTLWIPVRRLDAAAGSGGALMVAGGLLLPLVLLLPVAVLRARRAPMRLRDAAATGFWLALGISLYMEGVTRGHVARVILLFYLTVVWSTLLERLVLGHPLTGRRLGMVALGLLGMLVIFGAGAGADSLGSGGDWMGLAAGMAWSVGIVVAQRSPETGLFERVTVHFLFLGPVFLPVALLPGGGVDPALTPMLDPRALPWLFAFAFGWMLPVITLTVFAARHVSPGRFAILLMFEIVVGLTSAWLLAGEALHPHELVGAVLLLAAIGLELRGVRGSEAPTEPGSA